MTIWDILEIEQTNDIPAIKRAFARLVKKYHPEEEPEKWRAAYEAYQSALSRAANHALSQKAESTERPIPTPRLNAERQTENPLNTPSKLNFYELLKNSKADTLAHMEPPSTDSRILAALNDAKAIIANANHRNKPQRWLGFLYSEAFAEVAQEKELIDGLARLLNENAALLSPAVKVLFSDFYNLGGFFSYADAKKFKALFAALKSPS